MTLLDRAFTALIAGLAAAVVTSQAHHAEPPKACVPACQQPTCIRT